jgi:hypothetical protein
MVCREIDGTPVPLDDPRVIALLQAESPPPVITPLRDPQIAARVTACNSCGYRRDDKCTLMSCGCALKQRQASPFASCPGGRWPSLTADDAVR